MAVEIKVPALGESVTEATVAKWLVKAGDSRRGRPASVRARDRQGHRRGAGDRRPARWSSSSSPKAPTVQVGGVLCHIEAGGAGAAAAAPRPAAGSGSRRQPAPAPAPVRARQPAPARGGRAGAANLAASGPAVRKLAEEKGVAPAAIQPHRQGRPRDQGRRDGGAVVDLGPAGRAGRARPAVPAGPRPRAEREERVRMTRLRRTIANRLKEAQNTAAMLTTFNEVDMTSVMALRERMKEDFEKKHGARLGFMSFFVKACIAGLKELPAVNAEIEGDDLVYKNYYDIGVAVGTPQGPGRAGAARCRRARASAEIEKGIAELGRKARDGKLIDRRPDRRHLHHHQRRRLRLADVDADPQPAAVRHPRHAQDPAAADGGRRRDQGAADDVSRAVTTTTASSTAARP